MSQYDRTDRMLERARHGDANISEIEECIEATRADLDRNLSAIQQRLSPDELVTQAVDYLRDGPTEFLSNFGRTVRSNPVPVALLSVSLGWLMFAGRGSSSNGRGMRADRMHGDDIGRVYDGDDWDENSAYAERAYVSQDYPERTYVEADYSGRSYSGESSGADVSQDGEARGFARRMREGMHDRAAELSDRASHLSDQASDLSHRVGDKISEVGGRMSDMGTRTHHAFRHARDGIARAGSTLGQQPRRIREGYQDLAEHHPFVLGAVAFAIGAGIAASLRSSRIEDRVMGDLRDQAVDDAAHRARAELQRGMGSVRSALTEQEDETRDQMEMSGPGFESDEGTTENRSEPYHQDRIH